MTTKKKRAPAHLSDLMQTWWEQVNNDYQLEDEHRLILTAAAEAHDRADQARQLRIRLHLPRALHVDAWCARGRRAVADSAIASGVCGRLLHSTRPAYV